MEHGEEKLPFKRRRNLERDLDLNGGPSCRERRDGGQRWNKRRDKTEEKKRETSTLSGVMICFFFLFSFILSDLALKCVLNACKNSRGAFEGGLEIVRPRSLISLNTKAS